LNTTPAAYTVTLEPDDARRLARLRGQFDEHLHQIEKRLDIEIRGRGNVLALYGDASRARAASDLLLNLYRTACENRGIDRG